MTYIVRVIGMTEWNCSQDQKDFIDKIMSGGSKWIVMPNGKSFAAHSLQAISPRYSMKEWKERTGKTKDDYLKLVQPNLNKKLLA